MSRSGLARRVPALAWRRMYKFIFYSHFIAGLFLGGVFAVRVWGIVVAEEQLAGLAGSPASTS
jgi:hypothetical protein